MSISDAGDPTGQNDLVCANCGADAENRRSIIQGTEPTLGARTVVLCPQCMDDHVPILRSERKAKLDKERARIKADFETNGVEAAGPYKPCPQCGLRADGELRLIPGCDACDHTGYVLRSEGDAVDERRWSRNRFDTGYELRSAPKVAPTEDDLDGLKAWMERVVAKALADQGDVRDIFASRAMAALVRIGTTPQNIADEAYKMADAMMGARKPKEAEPEQPERVLSRTQRELARERRVVGNYIRGMTALTKQEAEDHASFIEAGHHRAGIEVLAMQDQEEAKP